MDSQRGKRIMKRNERIAGGREYLENLTGGIDEISPLNFDSSDDSSWVKSQFEISRGGS